MTGFVQTSSSGATDDDFYENEIIKKNIGNNTNNNVFQKSNKHSGAKELASLYSKGL